MADSYPKELPLSQGRNEVQNEIVKGAIQNNLVRIRYRDKDSNLTERNIEPYEIKGGKLFGYDPEKQGIRSFKLESITGARAENEAYEPRFPILIDNSMRI